MATDPRQLLNDSEEAFRIGFEGQQANMWTALPGIITAINFDDNTCSVQPVIQGSVEDENGNVTFVNLPVLIHVPIVFPRAGGFVLTFPMAIGDEVLVVFSSRSIDSWWQSGGIQKPVESRMHDLSDGFAIPGASSVPKAIAGISATDAQLRNESGDTFLSITADGKIKMTAPAGVEIEGDLTVTGEVTAGIIPLTTHVHGGVTTGGGVTGAPAP